MDQNWQLLPSLLNGAIWGPLDRASHGHNYYIDSRGHGLCVTCVWMATWRGG